MKRSQLTVTDRWQWSGGGVGGWSGGGGEGRRRECFFACVAVRGAQHGLEFQVTGTGSWGRPQAVQRSEPRCTLMLGERCVWLGAGLR